MKVGMVGASGYTGAELLRLCAGHPGFEVAVATADSHAGQQVAVHCPRWPAPTPSSSTARPIPTARRSRPRLLRPAARGVPAPGARAARTGRRHRRPGRRLPAAATPGPTRTGTEPSTRRPTCWPRSSTGCPSCSGPALSGATPGGRRRLLPDGRRPGPGPVRAGRGGRDRRASWSTRRAACRGRAGRRASACTSGRSTRTSPPTGCSTHRHTPEIEQAVGRPGALHPAPRPDGPGHPGHLLRPAGAGAAHDRRRPRSLAPGLRRRALRGRVRRAARPPRRPPGPTAPTSPPGSTSAPAGCSSCAALDNLVKGASGQAVQCANLVPGLPETTGLPVAGLYP